MYLSPLSMNLNSVGIWLFRIAAAVCSGAVFLAVMKYLPLKMPAKIGTATLGIYVLQSGFFQCGSKTTNTGRAPEHGHDDSIIPHHLYRGVLLLQSDLQNTDFQSAAVRLKSR